MVYRAYAPYVSYVVQKIVYRKRNNLSPKT